MKPISTLTCLNVFIAIRFILVMSYIICKKKKIAIKHRASFLGFVSCSLITRHYPSELLARIMSSSWYYVSMHLLFSQLSVMLAACKLTPIRFGDQRCYGMILQFRQSLFFVLMRREMKKISVLFVFFQNVSCLKAKGKRQEKGLYRDKLQRATAKQRHMDKISHIDNVDSYDLPNRVE